MQAPAFACVDIAFHLLALVSIVGRGFVDERCGTGTRMLVGLCFGYTTDGRACLKFAANQGFVPMISSSL